MPNFGFSAYLKLISLSDRRQKTEIRRRLLPSKDGYDFHRSLRLRANRYLVGGESLHSIAASVGEISGEPERKSVLAGLKYLGQWREDNPGKIISYSSAVFRSPSKAFSVAFTPDLGFKFGAVGTAIHLWNNKTPELIPRFIYAALSMFPERYSTDDLPPDDLGLLSLRNGTLFRLSDASSHDVLGKLLAEQVDYLFEEVSKELGLPPAIPKDPPPASPPPGL